MGAPGPPEIKWGPKAPPKNFFGGGALGPLVKGGPWATPAKGGPWVSVGSGI